MTGMISSEQAKWSEVQGSGQLISPLSTYPVFIKAKSAIAEEKSKKGVFRIRRILPEAKDPVTVAAVDLLTLEKIFGKVNKCFMKRHDEHLIISVLFEEGTIMHADYTFGRPFHFELEWSGQEKIITFNSDVNRAFSNENGILEACTSVKSDQHPGFTVHEVNQMVELMS
ncbi:hypothetical protein [Jeotgalibacillus malaysiensis]|uniref:hypothetical protein n=1 Tax=Jeotgalibacillus malaysiensis TaxID=1508404 RepID=UPI00384FA8BB